MSLNVIRIQPCEKLIGRDQATSGKALAFESYNKRIARDDEHT